MSQGQAKRDRMDEGGMQQGGIMLPLYALLGGLFNAAIIAAGLLIPAGLVPGGTWCWRRGLWCVAVFAVINGCGSMALAIARPASFRVRLQGFVAKADRKQPLADKVVTGLLLVAFFAWLAFIPLDVFSLRLLPSPGAALSLAGALAAIVGIVVMLLALAQNEFAAPNVQDQTAGAQRVIDTGLYGVVRHPMYAGALLMFAGLALWLQSYAAVIASAVFVLLLLARIAVEETWLREHLPGYADYARRVPNRLIPFVM